MTREISAGRPIWAYIGALCLAGSAAVASCYNGDQSCAQAYNQNDLGDHCPYGPPGGPKPGAFPSDCPLIDPIDDDAVCNAVSWTQVHDVLIAPEKGNCTDSACHANPIVDIAAFVPAGGGDDGGKTMLDALAKFTGSFGNAYPTVQGGDAVPRLYFDRASPERSWWLCNLRGDAGSLMPSQKPRMSEEDITLIEQWLACGAVEPM
jgi:hypothetical protein